MAAIGSKKHVLRNQGKKLFWSVMFTACQNFTIIRNFCGSLPITSVQKNDITRHSPSSSYHSDIIKLLLLLTELVTINSLISFAVFQIHSVHDGRRRLMNCSGAYLRWSTPICEIHCRHRFVLLLHQLTSIMSISKSAITDPPERNCCGWIYIPCDSELTVLTTYNFNHIKASKHFKYR